MHDRRLKPMAVPHLAALLGILTLFCAPLVMAQGPMSPGGVAPPPRPMTPPVVVVPPPITVVPSPVGGAPAPKSTASSSSNRQAGPPAQSLAATFDRWGKLPPAPNVALTARIGGGVMQTGSDGKGLFTVAAPTPGVSQLSIDLKTLPPSREPRRAIVIGLVLPRGDGKDVRIERAFPRGTQTINVQISVPRGGVGTTVNWGDRKPPVDVTRGKPVDPPSGPPQLMGFIGFWNEIPNDGDCDPQVQICGGGDPPPFDPPPPPDDPPIIFDPWTPPPDGDPIPETQITFTDDGGKGITETQTDGNGTFVIGTLDPGTHTLVIPGRALLPKVRSNAPKPPVKVALVLPIGKPGRDAPLRLVEHIYTRNDPGEAIRLKIMVPPSAGSTSVDWGDGTSRADVARDGKKVDPKKIKADAVGRVLFVRGAGLR